MKYKTKDIVAERGMNTFAIDVRNQQERVIEELRLAREHADKATREIEKLIKLHGEAI